MRRIQRIMERPFATYVPIQAHVYMLIVGEWQLFDDGATRPTVRAKALNSDGNLVTADFLIDSGADRTVFSAALLAQLRLPTNSAQPGFALGGIGGTTESVLVTTIV